MRVTGNTKDKRSAMEGKLISLIMFIQFLYLKKTSSTQLRLAETNLDLTSSAYVR